MKTLNNFKGLTGKQLLVLSNDQCTAVDVGLDCLVMIIPQLMTFSNRTEICTKEEATHVTVQHRFMDQASLIKI